MADRKLDMRALVCRRGGGLLGVQITYAHSFWCACETVSSMCDQRSVWAHKGFSVRARQIQEFRKLVKRFCKYLLSFSSPTDIRSTRCRLEYHGSAPETRGAPWTTNGMMLQNEQFSFIPLPSLRSTRNGAMSCFNRPFPHLAVTR